MKKLTLLLILVAIFNFSWGQNSFNDYLERWSFEDNADGENGYDGQALNGAAFSPEDMKEGLYSLYLVDIDGYFTAGIFDIFQELDNFTMSFWLKVAELPTDLAYFVIGQDNNWRMVLNPPGNLGFVVSVDQGWYGDGSNIESPTNLNVDTWYHITAVYDGTGNKSYIYIDGALDVENPKTISGQTADKGIPFVCGQGDGTYTANFNGLYDDVRFYDIALSAQEVENLYNHYEFLDIPNNRFNGVSIFPNPANDMVFLENISEESQIRIMNITGTTVYQTKTDVGNLTLDLSQFTKGLYIVNIENSLGKYSEKLMIK